MGSGQTPDEAIEIAQTLAKLRVEAGRARVEGVVREAHVSEAIPLPHLVGTEHDRYINKTWKPLTLGALKLPAGPAKLVVRTTETPRAGAKSIELKELLLTKTR